MPLVPSLIANWSEQSFLVAPSEMLSPSDNTVREVEFIGPRGDWLRATVERKNPVRHAIALLLLLGRPSTIAWFVIAVVVWVAIQGVLLAGPRPHVGQKLDESTRAAPLLAHRYSTTTVAVKVPSVVVSAAVDHVVPRYVLASSLPPSRVAVAGVHSNEFLFSDTAATFRPATSQCACRSSDGVSALAAAEPPGFSLNSANKRDGSQQAESLASEVYEVRVARLRIRRSHRFLQLGSGGQSRRGGTNASRLDLLRHYPSDFFARKEAGLWR
jgi:hypothetical protein